MTVHQCDNCNKIIAKGEQVIVGRDILGGKVEICPQCAAPIMKSVEASSLSPKLKEKLRQKSKYY